MIKNHLIDPEGSPDKSNIGYSSLYNNSQNYAADPWYSSSPTEIVSDKFSYGMYDQSASIIANGPPIEEDYDNEPPLLEELGIRFDQIWSKTQAVVNPTKQLNESILDDADLAGPVFFCLLMGSFLLFSGKLHFGYIYGFSVCGCLGMHTMLNLLLLNNKDIDIWLVCSVLGYCLIPVLGLAGISPLLKLQSVVGVVLAVLVICWSTHSATRLFHAKLCLMDQYWLVAYPVMLLYSCFVIITIF